MLFKDIALDLGVDQFHDLTAVAKAFCRHAAPHHQQAVSMFYGDIKVVRLEEVTGTDQTILDAVGPPDVDLGFIAKPRLFLVHDGTMLVFLGPFWAELAILG